MNLPAGIATVQSLVITAAEEAARDGRRTPDIEHVLLALTLDDADAGIALRSSGVTLDRVRAAIAEQRRHDLAALGVDAPAEIPGRAEFPEAGAEPTERANAVIRRAFEPPRGTLLTLEALLDDPSGLIEALLARAGSSTSAVRAAIATLDETPPAITYQSTDPLIATRSAFIPASRADVWTLVNDPTRIPEWDPILAAVVEDGADGWTATAASTAPNGSPARVRPGTEIQHVDVIERIESHRVAYRFTYPANPRLNSRRITIDVAPAAGGSRIALEVAWERSAAHSAARSAGRILRPLLRPLARLAVATQARHLAGGIGRVFR